MSTKIEPLTLQIEEAAKLLGIGRNHCYELAKRGQIPALRLGRRLVVPRAALDQLLQVTPKAAV